MTPWRRTLLPFLEVLQLFTGAWTQTSISFFGAKASLTLFAELCSLRTCPHPDSIATPDRPRVDSCRAPPQDSRLVSQSVPRLPPLTGRSSGRLDCLLSVLGACWQLCKNLSRPFQA